MLVQPPTAINKENNYSKTGATTFEQEKHFEILEESLAQLKIHKKSELFKNIYADEDDPIFLIKWDHSVLRTYTDILNNLQQNIPSNVLHPNDQPPYTESLLAWRITSFIEPSHNRIICDGLIAPNTMGQFIELGTRASHLSSDPLFNYLTLGLGPIGFIYYSTGRGDRITLERAPVSPHPNGHGVIL